MPDRKQRKGQKPAPGPALWFVAYKEFAPGMMGMRCIGPFTVEEAPRAIEYVLMAPETDCDGVYEWDGEPDQRELVELVQTPDKGIGSHPNARRLFVHPRHEAELRAMLAATGSQRQLVVASTRAQILAELGRS